MSYAAKWVPTPAHGADKQLHFASALSFVLFPGEGIDRGREMLQKKILSPLRKVMSVPESEMKEGAWKVDYAKVGLQFHPLAASLYQYFASATYVLTRSQVPSRSMQRNAASFMKHDREGFEKYLLAVKHG
jgi:hypothetical protein